LSTEEHLAELGEAARRAGSIVTEHINSIVDGAERQAERIRSDAELDADRTRREAVDSARRLLQHLHALEQPLGQLVMNLQAEVDRVAGELGSGGYVDAQATAIPAPAEAEEEPAAPEQAEEAPAEPIEDAQPVDEPDEALADEPDEALAEEPAEAEPPAAEGEPQAEEREPRRGLFRRLRRTRQRTFVTTEGYCAVCQRAFMAGSEDSLRLSGWRVSGEVGLCPDCQSEGWQLPEGARLPFRRGGG
jgi:hypothetical protein